MAPHQARILFPTDIAPCARMSSVTTQRHPATFHPIFHELQNKTLQTRIGLPTARPWPRRDVLALLAKHKRVVRWPWSAEGGGFGLGGFDAPVFQIGSFPSSTHMLVTVYQEPNRDSSRCNILEIRCRHRIFPPKTRDANEPRELVWVFCHPKRSSGALFRTMGLGNGHLKRFPYEAQVCYKL